MTQLDNHFTEKLQRWLNLPHSSEEMIKEGALLLLQLNKNRVLYNNILRQPTRQRYRERLEYELNKHLQIRLAGLTQSEVAAMDARVLKVAESIIASQGDSTGDSQDEQDEETRVLKKGKRPDHDQLPEKIQQLFNSCGGVYKKIRKLHTMLKGMENLTSCDRYEYLKQMDELDEIYRKRMREYDEYKAGTTSASPASESKNTEQEGKDVNVLLNNERSYLKRLKVRLKKAYDERGISEVTYQAYEDMLSEAIPHINKLLSLGGRITEKSRYPLRQLGVKFPDEENANAKIL
jgi:hypothetical protein